MCTMKEHSGVTAEVPIMRGLVPTLVIQALDLAGKKGKKATTGVRNNTDTEGREARGKLWRMGGRGSPNNSHQWSIIIMRKVSKEIL